MPFQEAFNVKPNVKEGAKMEVNANAFQRGGQLEEKAATEIKSVQENLNWMQQRMKKDLNADEMKVAWLAIERELENSIPSTFKASYEGANWTERAELINGQILSGLEQFIRTRLEDVIAITDDESWTGSVSRSEAANILKKLNPSVTDDEVKAFQARYVQPNLLDQGAMAVGQRSTMRRAADEAMNMK
jgi:hypothetical protein